MESGNNVDTNINLEASKKGNNKWLLIIIIILLSILTLLFAYYLFFFENDNNSDDNKQSSDVVEKEENNNDIENDVSDEEIVNDLSLDDPVVKELSDKVIGIYTANHTTEYIDYFYKQDKLDINKESFEFKMALSTYEIARNALDDSSLSNVTLTESKVKNAYESLFGKNGGYLAKTFSSSYCGVQFEYVDGIYDSHTYGGGGCGGTSAGFSKSSLAYAKSVTTSTMDKIELYEYYYYVDYSQGDDTVYYSDYNRTNMFFAGDSISKEEVINKYKDKLGQYKYTFIKDNDGVYVFTNVERVK